ncbi:MAG: hypothetical protein ACPGPF_00525 [Pontibacterium sp.]
MTSHNLAAHIRYLLKKGHAADDITLMIDAPKALIKAEVERFSNAQQSQDSLESSRRAQASYAMKI